MSGAKRVATAGLVTAAALILSYLESLIPFDFGVPGIKLGLANAAVLVALVLLSPKYAAAVSVVRVLINGLLFTGVSAMLYALSGAVFALGTMLLLRKSRRLGLVGVSVGGAVAHIVGQLCCAMLVLKSGAVWFSSPLMFAAAAVTGTLNGVIAGLVCRGVRQGYHN